MTAKQFQAARKKTGMTQQALAHELEVGVGTISRWENEVLAVPKAFDLAMRYLVANKRNGRQTGRA